MNRHCVGKKERQRRQAIAQAVELDPAERAFLLELRRARLQELRAIDRRLGLIDDPDAGLDSSSDAG